MKKKKKLFIRKNRARKRAERTQQNKAQVPTSDRAFEAKERAFDALAKMRQDAKVSLVTATRQAGTTSATVRKYLPAALRKSKKGLWVATKSDRYVRILSLPGPHGPVTVRARGSKEARLASAYLASLGRWGRSGKASELAPFRRKKIGGFELVTAPHTLRALREAGFLQLDSLYAAVKDAL